MNPPRENLGLSALVAVCIVLTWTWYRWVLPFVRRKLREHYELTRHVSADNRVATKPWWLWLP